MRRVYPFKFLDPYGQGDKDFFFGREEETDQLYKMVFESNILFVYGMSGTGKTSLIQCGLASKFQSFDWLGINIRKGKNINESILNSLHAACKRDDEKSQSEHLTINQLFKAIYRLHFKPIYLIFDQFEELFILGDEEEQTKFIEIVKEILSVEQPVKLLFIIREEYLGHLYYFEKAVPHLLKKKLRVESMNLAKIKEVIQGATTAEGSNIKLKIGETDKIATRIFNRVKGKENTLTVQLPYLQVFLDKLYLSVTNDDNRQAEAVFSVEALDHIGDIEDVLRDFLEEQVQKISHKLSSSGYLYTTDAIWSILSHFATLEGTKEPIAIDSLAELAADIDKKIISATITAFVDGRILLQSEVDGRYELVHDSLAKKIAEKRTDEDIALLEVKKLIKNQSALNKDAHELLTAKQLNFVEPYLRKMKFTDEEEYMIAESRRKVNYDKNKLRRRRQLIIGSGIFLFVVMMVLTTVAFFSEKRAKFNEKKAEDSEKEAYRERNLLEERNTELKNSKRAAALFAANFHFSSGNSIFRENKQEALASYKQALNYMKDYPSDSLYAEIITKINLCH